MWMVVWALMRDPGMSIMVVSLLRRAGQDHFGEARRIIDEHAEVLGYRLSPYRDAMVALLSSSMAVRCDFTKLDLQ